MANKHIYVTNLDGDYTHYLGYIEWYETGFVITVAGGVFHHTNGYYVSVAVLDISIEEVNVLQQEAMLKDVQSRDKKECAIVGIND